MGQKYSMQSLFLPAILFPRVVSLWQPCEEGNICFGPVQTAGRRQAYFKRKSTTKKETQTSQRGCDLRSVAPSFLPLCDATLTQSKGGWLSKRELQPEARQYSCLQPGLEGAPRPMGRRWERCLQGDLVQTGDAAAGGKQGKGCADTRGAEALGGLCACQLGSSSL